MTTRAAIGALAIPLPGAPARRGSIEIHADNAGVEADAGLKLFETKWVEGEVGASISTPWTKFEPVARGLFRFRFW